MASTQPPITGPPLAAEGHQLVVAAITAAQAREAVSQDAALEEGVEHGCALGRGTNRRGAAILPFISPALQQVDAKRLIISASRGNAVSVELRAKGSTN